MFNLNMRDEGTIQKHSSAINTSLKKLKHNAAIRRETFSFKEGNLKPINSEHTLTSTPSSRSVNET
jgi:hypothetical protein